jgi:hypothetical protein
MITKEMWIKEGYRPIMHYLNALNFFLVIIALTFFLSLAFKDGSPTSSDELIGYTIVCYIPILFLVYWLIRNAVRRRPSKMNQWFIRSDVWFDEKWREENLKDNRGE